MKIIRVIIIIFIIINLILMGYLLMYKKQEPQEPLIAAEHVATEYLNNKIFPQGYYELTTVYKGNLDLSDLYEKLNNLVNTLIPEILSNNQDTEKYYNLNKKYIKNSTGIKDEEDFNALCNILKNYNVQNLEYDYCEFLSNTYKEDDEKYKFDIKINYKTEQELNIEVTINDKNNTIQITPIEEEK